MYWLISCCVLVLGVGLVPGSGVAQVSMEARLGLQGVVRLGKLNVVTVQVHNAGEPLAGVLGVRTWLGSEARGDFHVTTFTRPVELPPGARKRFTFAVPRDDQTGDAHGNAPSRSCAIPGSARSAPPRSASTCS